MLDEVQCGIGRTGKWFAHQWAGIVPDVMPLAKGLGSGVPIGAVVCGPRAAKVLGAGNHGTTFGGNPLAMRAGVETLAVMEADGLLANATQVGAELKAALEQGLAGVPGFVEVRGRGLMLGIELARPCGVLLGQAAESGPADQRDRGLRRASAAGIDRQQRRGHRDRRASGAADQGLPHGARAMKPGDSLMRHYLQFKDLRAECRCTTARWPWCSKRPARVPACRSRPACTRWAGRS
ncbi:aminotransferase class-III domain-containing protein [Ditylenchus destructor]|nr:aminotransferase class-III domain-containing protein [Ditylenchus destructor]